MKKIFPIQWCRNEHVFHRGYSDHCYTAQWEACPFLRAALIQLEPAYCPGRSLQNRGRPILVMFTCLSSGVRVHLTRQLSRGSSSLRETALIGTCPRLPILAVFTPADSGVQWARDLPFLSKSAGPQRSSNVGLFHLPELS